MKKLKIKENWETIVFAILLVSVVAIKIPFENNNPEFKITTEECYNETVLIATIYPYEINDIKIGSSMECILYSRFDNHDGVWLPGKLESCNIYGSREKCRSVEVSANEWFSAYGSIHINIDIEWLDNNCESPVKVYGCSSRKDKTSCSPLKDKKLIKTEYKCGDYTVEVKKK